MSLLMNRRAALCGMAAVGLVTAGGNRAWAAGERWDLTIHYGPGHSLTKLYNAYADAVRERTGGALDITVRTAGELPFGATEAVTVLGQQQVQMALGYQGFIAGTTRIAALPGLPFLIRTEEDANRAMPVLKQHIDAKLAQQGCRMLMYTGQNWPQNIYGRGEPMQRLEDLHGRNARGSSPEQGDLIRHFGGAPVTLTTAEVPEAMHRGVVDAVFTGSANIIGSNWTEFLDWAYLCDPHGAIEYLMINSELYDGLAPEVRTTLDEVSAEQQTVISDARRASAAEALEELSKDLTIVQAAPEDVARYSSDWAADYWTAWAEGDTDIVQAVAEVREALGK